MWNVHIVCWGDLELVREAIESVPDGVSIHVFDGRYHDFDGESDLTAGLEAACRVQSDVTYHEPPPDCLPFGDPTLPGEWRSSVHEKSRWVFDTLPSDEWTVKLDADERLRPFDTSRFGDLGDDWKLPAVVHIQDDRTAYPTRVWKPRHWTPWIDDCLLPRDRISRDASLRERYEAWQDYQIRFARYFQTELVEIDNVGLERPPSYQQRRIAHLNRIGREERADELRELTTRKA